MGSLQTPIRVGSSGHQQNGLACIVFAYRDMRDAGIGAVSVGDFKHPERVPEVISHLAPFMVGTTLLHGLHATVLPSTAAAAPAPAGWCSRNVVY